MFNKQRMNHPVVVIARNMIYEINIHGDTLQFCATISPALAKLNLFKVFAVGALSLGTSGKAKTPGKLIIIQIGF
jgi:hypothetical protein